MLQRDVFLYYRQHPPMGYGLTSQLANVRLGKLIAFALGHRDSRNRLLLLTSELLQLEIQSAELCGCLRKLGVKV